MADAADLKSAGGDSVWVRLPPALPLFEDSLFVMNKEFFCKIELLMGAKAKRALNEE